MTRIAAVLSLLALAPAGAATEGAGTPSRPADAGQPPSSAPRATDAGKPGAPRPAPAPRADTSAPPSQAAVDLARALTTQATWDGILDAYASSLTGQISAALGASGEKPAPDLREKIRADLHETVRYDQAIELQARALAFRFTQDELGALERFYRSGPGKKLLDVLPEVSREVNDDLRVRLSERVPQIIQKNAPSLAKGEGGGAGRSGTASGGGSGASGSEGSKDGKAQGRTPPPATKR